MPEVKPTFDELVEIRRVIGAKGASQAVVEELTTRYSLESGYVGLVAETMREEGLSIGADRIFESAPQPKGTTMPGKPSLNDSEIREVLRILRVNGQGPQVISNLSKQYHVAESIITAMGTIVTETDRKNKLLTESAGTAFDTATSPGAAPPGLSGHQMARAQLLKDRVNLAESRSSISECSTQELEALAVARFGLG